MIYTFIIYRNFYKIHGITEEIAQNGESFISVMKLFYADFRNIKHMIGHNVSFDVNVMKSEMIRKNLLKLLKEFDTINKICTMHHCKNIVNIKTKKGTIKFPKQSELYCFVLNKSMQSAHNSKYDVFNLGKIVTRLIENKQLKL